MSTVHRVVTRMALGLLVLTATIAAPSVSHAEKRLSRQPSWVQLLEHIRRQKEFSARPPKPQSKIPRLLKTTAAVVLAPIAIPRRSRRDLVVPDGGHSNETRLQT